MTNRKNLELKLKKLFNELSTKEKEEFIIKTDNESKREKQEINAFLIASKNGDYQAVQNMLKNGINPNKKDEKGNTALHMAALAGNVDIVKLLIANNADLEQKNAKDSTVLDAAQLSKEKRVITFLEGNKS